MSDRPLKILLTNDDGIHAPGLEVLEKIAMELSDDIWIIAPDSEQSGASHSLTLHMPLRLRQLGDKRFSVLGTPTDCVMMAVEHVGPKYGDMRPFDLVLSGVNRGSNMADDVTYSGTIAGAMEGIVLGVPSIALSQSYSWEAEAPFVPWECAQTYAPSIIKRLLAMGWAENVLINLNFPDLKAGVHPEIEVTSQGTRDQSLTRVEHRMDTRGGDYFWLGFMQHRSDPPEGTDIRAIYDGRISITPLHLNLTEHSSIERLATNFSDHNFDDPS